MSLPRTRPAQERTIGKVRPLTRKDVAALTLDRPPVHQVQKLRDSHHMLARCIASGMSKKQAAVHCGRSVNGVNNMAEDPSFKELVAHYRSQAHEKWLDGIDSFFDLATSNMLKAERMLADRLDAADEDGEPLPVKQLLDISRDAADRFGYGKKKEVTHNVNVDFAAKLEQARARSATVIEATAQMLPSHSAPVGRTRPVSDPSMALAEPSSFRRRA